MNITTEAFILTAEPRTIGETSTVLLYAASPLGPLEILSDFSPYFFVATARTLTPDLERKLAAEGPVVEEGFRSLNGERVQKYMFSSIFRAERARGVLRDAGVPLFESDVRPRERFLMDRGLNGSIRLEGQAEKRGKALSLRNPKLRPSGTLVPLRVCSVDIETSVSSGNILSIAAHLPCAKDERLVFMLGRSAPDPGVKVFPTEAALLEAFEKWFTCEDPDLIIGWNVIGFDLAYLKRRSAALGIPLRLGRGNRDFSINESTGRFSRANVPGRVVLDGPHLLRNSFYSFDSYSLEHVARQVLGEGKLIAPTSNRASEIERLFRDDPSAFAAYNIKDAILVSGIFERLGLLDLTLRRSQLSGMLLDQIGLSTASFDHFYLPRLHAEGYVAPDIGETGEVTPARGGHVLDPVTGMYDDVIGLDFRSLYPSIIETFNIDPLSRACADLNPLATPSGLRFSRTRSILPGFIAELKSERQRAKETQNVALSQAIKILMNSFYGVMGSSGSRLYHPALPDAITSTGQWLLTESKRWLEERGHRVIYGDTDSLFVQLSREFVASIGDTQGAARTISESITQFWTSRLYEDYGVVSQLLLEFKKHFRKFFVPSGRLGGAAKKRYAGLVVDESGEKVEFVGLEAVRSDWTRLARDFQSELYSRIFRGQPVEEWIRDFVGTLRSGRFDDKLVYRKRLHKQPNEYDGSPPPYVRAALMLQSAGREVRYVMTTKGPIPIELSPANPDYAHYIERQLRPAADSILTVLGTSFDRILTSQLSLFTQSRD